MAVNNWLAPITCAGLFLAACTNSSGVHRTPTPSSIQTLRLIEPSNVPFGISLVPSPDGHFIAEIDLDDRHQVKIYDSSTETIVARSTIAGPSLTSLQWLPDSSALLAWGLDSAFAPGPLFIVTSAGDIHSMDLRGGDIAVSNDGNLATILPTPGSADYHVGTAIQVSDRQGKNSRSVAVGSDLSLIGWQGSQIIYEDHRTLYSIGKTGGAPVWLTGTSPFDLGTPDSGPNSSPDGDTLILRKGHEGFMAFANGHLVPLPGQTLIGRLGPFWIAPHEILGITGEGTASAVIIDASTGHIEQSTVLIGLAVLLLILKLVHDNI